MIWVKKSHNKTVLAIIDVFFLRCRFGQLPSSTLEPGVRRLQDFDELT